MDVYPTVFSFSVENIQQKLALYNSIGLHDIILIRPQILIQSFSLSYARYHYYLDNGIQINMDNYNPLFMGNKKFEIITGISKDKLLEMYPCEEVIIENTNVKSL